jgi:hypothetical protein
MASAGMIVGLSVGWQATVGVCLMTLMLRPIMFAVARRWNLGEPPMTAILLVAYLIHLISWRWLTTSWWPSTAMTPVFWTILPVAFISLWLVNRFLSGLRQPIQDSGNKTEAAVMTNS